MAAPPVPRVAAVGEIRAVFWDFGGVILTSPFEAFNEYERAHGLPTDFIRSVNAADPAVAATLTGAGQHTVFAPTDEAFADLHDGTVEMLLMPENKD